MIAGRHNPLGRQSLPYAFRVEYLESTGTQWIDTGVYSMTGADKVDFRAKFAWTDLSRATQLFGANYARYFGANYASEYNTGELMQIGQVYERRIVLEKGLSARRYIFRDGEWVYESGQTTVSGHYYPFYLFAISGFINGLTLCLMRLYAASVLVNDVEMLDAVPVVDLNGTPCLYDRVTGEFLYNKGSGAFTAGPRVVDGGGGGLNA